MRTLTLLALFACDSDEPKHRESTFDTGTICGDRTCQPCEPDPEYSGYYECDATCGLVWHCKDAPPNDGPCPGAVSVWLKYTDQCECIRADNRQWQTNMPDCMPDPYGQ